MDHMKKMLIALVIDNSASMKGEKMTRLKQALEKMVNHLSKHPIIEYSITVFDGLNPVVVKDFSDDHFDVNTIHAHGLPILGETMKMSLNHLLERAKVLTTQNMSFYRPWFMVLSDGYLTDDISDAIISLSNHYLQKRLTYFPFILSSHEMDETLIPLFKIKKPLMIKDFKYDFLFQWLHDTLIKRISIPMGETFRLDSHCFDGWVEK